MGGGTSERTSPWVIAGRVLFTAALIGCVAFIFANSMQAAQASSAQSGQVLSLLQQRLARLGLSDAAQHLTMRFVRKLAHFCEYLLEGALLMLCLRVYTRRPLRHLSVPMLCGLLTALTDETIQRFTDGRSSQVTDVWLDFAGVLSGILLALLLLALCRLCFRFYQHRNEDQT